MTNGETLILKEIARMQEQLGSVQVSVATLSTLPKRVEALEGFKNRTLMAIGASGLLTGGGLVALLKAIAG